MHVIWTLKRKQTQSDTPTTSRKICLLCMASPVLISRQCVLNPFEPSSYVKVYSNGNCTRTVQFNIREDTSVKCSFKPSGLISLVICLFICCIYGCCKIITFSSVSSQSLVLTWFFKKKNTVVLWQLIVWKGNDSHYLVVG